MAEKIGVFVSHHHSPEEDAFTARLVDDLERASADVWVDYQGISSGSFVQKINEGLAGRQWLVLVMTPAALASPWVRDEVNAALHQVKTGRMRDVIPFVMTVCDEALIPPLWAHLHRYDATHGYEGARDQLFGALGLPPAGASPSAPAPVQPAPPSYAAPPERFPPRLASLGYQVAFLNGAEVILPPLCAVPEGPFLMGSDPGRDKDAQKDEQPQHWVKLDAFEIAQHPVTVAEYACFVRATQQSEPKGHGPLTWALQLDRRLEHPVVNVTWEDAVAYARWLAERTGQPWRLPTEAEWEKAARWDPTTGTARIYPWGDAFDGKLCNTSEGKKGTTIPVGSHSNSVSPYGAQEMSGNVWERTSSLYLPYPYTSPDDGKLAGPAMDRVLRGGSWENVAKFARAACRGKLLPTYSGRLNGFRLARAVPS
jgi:formylglycine-generating enzyme required for sulfatase activity